MTSIPMVTDYVNAKIKIGEIEFTADELEVESIKISNGAYDGSVFGVGAVYLKSAEITMKRMNGITKGLNMEILFEYQGAWISFGTFVVSETPVNDGNRATIKLESLLSQNASKELTFDTVKQEFTLQEIISRVEDIVGKGIVFKPSLSSDEQKTFLDGKTACFLKDINNYIDPAIGTKTGISIRDILAGISALYGGNAYENTTGNSIVIKAKTFTEDSSRYIGGDNLSSSYQYSQEKYMIKTINMSFNNYCYGMYNPPNASGVVFTLNYLGEDKVSDLLLASNTSTLDKCPYDYTITCDWAGWTCDGSKFDVHQTPGGRVSACFRQGDLVYRTCEMEFVGIDFGWNIAPGNLLKVKVPEFDDPIEVLCGEVVYSWDGGFTTSISCNCNIESNGSYSTTSSTQAAANAVAQDGRQTSLALNYANIKLSNVEDSTISGSIFKDGTIVGSKFEDGTIENSKIKDGTIIGSKIQEGTITGSLIKAATITGSLIVNGTIRNEHIMDSAIDNSKIADSSITGSKFEDGTIENSKIKDSTLTNAKIKDATIGFEKVNTSFINDLTANEAYIADLKAKIADIGYLTADEADIKYATVASLEVVDGKINNLETIAITTNNLSAKVADLGYLKVDTADLKYANIELSNIDVANVGTLFANVGLIDRATIVDGHVTGFLDSVEVNANKITAGTLVADRILLKGSESGLLYALNNLGELTSTEMNTLNGDILTDRTINADKIVASSITANELDVDDIFADSAVVSKIFAQNITATGIITGATLVGASISADRGTIGGFSIFDTSFAGSYDENGYHYQVELNTDKSYTDGKGRTYALYASKDKKEPFNIENEWYVTYDGYMYAETGEIAGFNLSEKTLVSESEITPSGSASTFYYKSKMNSQFNQEEDFLTLTCTVNESVVDKVVYGIDGLSIDTSSIDYYKRWMTLSGRSISFGVNGGATPYNGSATAFKFDAGYAPITGSGEFSINPSCEINVATTIRSALRVESDPTSGAEKSFVRINNHEVQLHAINSSVNFYLSAYSGSSNKFRLYSTTGNIIDVTDTTAMTITPKITASNGITEQGYGVIGCTVTTSGNFTCKKYRDGRLIIEWKKTLTSKMNLSSVDGSIHFATPQNGDVAFPVAFTATPGVVSGLAIPDLSIPFCALTIDGVTKSTFKRAIVWNTGNVSSAVLPSGTVVSATFTGRWK